jgi:hypothetical protein
MLYLLLETAMACGAWPGPCDVDHSVTLHGLFQQALLYQLAGGGFGAVVRLNGVILRCPATIPATFDYLCARDQCGGLAGTAAILVAMGAEVGGG